MAKDAELDQLKAAQDLAFQRKQDAYKTQQSAWERRSAARERMNRAYEAKSAAYDRQQSAWESLQRVRDRNGPRIDQLKSQQETAYRNMVSAFESSKSAYDRRDGASAKSYSEEGRRYKEEAQRCTAERRGLVDEIRQARAVHDSVKGSFQVAKAEFDDAKRSFDAAKAEHERAQEVFRRAKDDFDRAAKAFRDRLEQVRAQSQRRRDDKRTIAERAGVPHQYLDDLWVSTDTNGNTNIYFGGAGKPNGPGHGHYVVDRSGKVTYKRDPFDPHGAQNFEDDESYVVHQRSQGHSGGFGLPSYGYIGDHPVTFALGWGTKAGHTLIADGHVNRNEFRNSRNHDHYGPGDGPNNNGTLRRLYTGPGA